MKVRRFFLIGGGVVLALCCLVSCVVSCLPFTDRAPASATPTPTATSAVVVSVASPTSSPAGLVHLRVEIQQPVNIWSGTWGPFSGVTVAISPYKEGDSGPDLGRKETQRKESQVATTTDNVKVAIATFDVAPGLYWVVVGPPAGCGVWSPVLEKDSADQIVPGPWRVIRLDIYGGFNTTVEKFQLVCGVATQSPKGGGGPTVTSTANPPTATSTGGPPTVTPPTVTPTESCGPDCIPPSTPVSTPTDYPSDVPTPTSVR